jgi:hypothetical protein
MSICPITFAKVGDTIETSVRHPVPRVIRLRLDTPAACGYANVLLSDAKSGWRLVGETGHKVVENNVECPAPSCDECHERGACTAEEDRRKVESN